MRRADRFVGLSTTLACVFLFCAEIESHAADLPIPPPLTKLQRSFAAPTPPLTNFEPREIRPPLAAKPPALTNAPPPVEQTISLPTQPVEIRPEPVIAAPAPPPVIAHVSAADIGPSVAPQPATPASAPALLSTLAELATFGLGFIAALIGLLILPSLLRGLDALLAAPLECDGGDAPLFQDADARGFDFPDRAQPDLSAADIHRQTEVLRALKAALDAELDSVRATIRHERTRAKQAETERTMQ